MEFIKRSSDGGSNDSPMYYWEREGDPKMALQHGEEKFLECIEFLNKMKPMLPLAYNQKLNIKVPLETSKWNENEILADLLAEKKVNLAEHYLNYQFQYDIGLLDPIVSAVMQVVDDNPIFNGKRRANILNRNLTNIGIMSRKCGKKNCVYMLFARRKKKEKTEN